MRRNLLFLIGILVLGCSSTLQLKSSQTAYQRTGLGRESPQEIANADLTMAYASAIREDPDVIWRGYYGYGYGSGFGSTDPCYYYPAGACPMAGPMSGEYVSQDEVKEIVEEEFGPVEQKLDGINKSLDDYLKGEKQ